jgi:hypothetical protein
MLSDIVLGWDDGTLFPIITGHSQGKPEPFSVTLAIPAERA